MTKAQIETLVTTVTTKKFTIKLSGAMVLEILRQQYKIPPGSKVYFQVPGGGDWSNMAIDVDGDNPVWIEWQSEEVKDTRE